MISVLLDCCCTPVGTTATWKCLNPNILLTAIVRHKLPSTCRTAQQTIARFHFWSHAQVAIQVSAVFGLCCVDFRIYFHQNWIGFLHCHELTEAQKQEDTNAQHGVGYRQKGRFIRINPIKQRYQRREAKCRVEKTGKLGTRAIYDYEWVLERELETSTNWRRDSETHGVNYTRVPRLMGNRW